MKMKTTSIVMSLFLAAAGLGAEQVDVLPVQPGTAARPPWHKAPTVSVMTGFIYEPKKPYTIQQWMENLGSKFDADQWVKDFQEAGASYVIFYDKWIDGLVFHDTKTTNFKTKRDFLRELAAACQRGGLPLVLYFNAISDGNPEFDEWSLLDREGKPIVFGDAWPTRYQTLHSPFRQKCLEQVRELLSNYGPIHGIWFDIFHERFHTTSPWTARGYQQMFGEPFEKATGPRLAEFQVRTLAGYLDEVKTIRLAAASGAVRVHSQRIGQRVTSAATRGRNKSARSCNTSSTRATVSRTTSNWPAWRGRCRSRWTSTCCWSVLGSRRWKTRRRPPV